MNTPKPVSVDEYISQSPKETRVQLTELRECLRKVAPDAKQLLKWGKPAFEAEYILFVYAGFKKHVSLHPTLEVMSALQDELKDYATSSNTLKFPLDKPLPLKLISKVATLRVKQSKHGVTWK